MLSNNYYRFLTLPFEFFDQRGLTEQKSKNLNRLRNNHWNNLTEILYPSTYNFFSKFNYKIINVELFYTPPNGELVWHIDMNPPEEFMKINFVWGADSHLMLWGELKNNDRTYQTSKTKVDTQYIRLDDSDVIVKEGISIDKPAIVNVGKPHKILNYSEVGRWCLSIILTYCDQRIMFKDAVYTLNEYVVDSL